MSQHHTPLLTDHSLMSAETLAEAPAEAVTTKPVTTQTVPAAYNEDTILTGVRLLVVFIAM